MAALVATSTGLAQATAPATVESADSAKSEEDIVVLSPFIVSAEQDKGYMATNTMSGTRVNTRIEDLASSISVVTKQQLLDTAAVDLNDIFMYEGNTEGTHTYTAFEIDAKGNPVDTAGVDPNKANRVRGMGAANVAMGGYATQVRLPVDTYNIDSIEISRGPNSSIFGLGESSGTVNLNMGRANVGKNFYKFGTEFDSNDGKRATVDANQAIIKDKLALRFMGLYEDKGFTRRPSKDRTDRMTFAVTARPFKYTTIRASVETYNNTNSRPNSVTPRDLVTPWIEAGSPTWRPLEQRAYINGVAQQFVQVPDVRTGASLGWQNPEGHTLLMPVGSAAPAGYTVLGTPGYNQRYTTIGGWGTGLGINGIGDYSLSRLNMYIDQGEIELYTSARGTNAIAATSTLVPGPVQSANNYFMVSSGQTFSPGQAQLWKPKGVSNRDIYDWENINFAAPNIATKYAQISNVELEQFFINNANHQLALQLGWLKEHSKERRRNYVGQADGAPAQIVIDVNETLLDGTPNPYFLRPFVAGGEPQTYEFPVDNENRRATLAYQLDYSNERNWLKWIGRHNFVGYTEQRDTHYSPQGLRYQDRITTDTPWNARFAANGDPYRKSDSGAHTKATYRYYAGDNSGFNIDYAPVRPADYTGTRTVHWYNGKTGQWVDETVTTEELYFALGTQKEQIRTKGLIWQGYLFRNCIKWLPDFEVIPTLGRRWDDVGTRVSGGYYDDSGAWVANADLVRNTWVTVDGKRAFVSNASKSLVDENGYDLMNQAMEVAPTWLSNVAGVTDTKGVVVRLNKYLAFHYNESDSFKPEGLAYNVLTEQLPNPTGEGKDYGFTINLFDGKLNLRVNKYETIDQYTRNGVIGAVASRPPRIDFDARNGSWSGDLSSYDKYNLEASLFNWAIAADHVTRDDIAAMDTATRAATIEHYMDIVWANPALAELSFGGLTGKAYRDWVKNVPGTLADTNTITSKGLEFEVNYNPVRYFSIKATVSKTEAVDSELAASIMKYAAARLPVWESIMVPSNLQMYDSTAGSATFGQWIPDPDAGQPWWTTVLVDTTSAFDNYASMISTPMAWATANAGKPRAQNREWKARLSTRFDFSGVTESRIWSKLSLGGSLRWEDKAAIGFLAAEPDSDGIIRSLDVNKPVYDSAKTYVDFWIAYRMRLFKEKVDCTVQLNVYNVFENGGLQVIGINPDGEARDFRIVDPRLFKLSVRFAL